MHSMEPIEFSRDCRVIAIPDGFEVPVALGSHGWVTQVLGGHYTVQLTTGRLVRVSAWDAGAIGEAVAQVRREEREVDRGAPVSVEQVWDELRQCYDPEIPLDIVEIGLIYDVRSETHAEGGHRVEIDMTLTAPGCGMGQILADDVEMRVKGLLGVREAVIELVFDPPWTPDRMSEAGRLELGMFW